MRKKDFWLGIGVVAMVLVLTVVTFVRSALPTAAWGLSFHHSGQTTMSFRSNNDVIPIQQPCHFERSREISIR